MIEQIRHLFEHIEWADQRAIESLRAAPAVEREVVAVMAHIVGAEETWLARVEQREPDLPVWPALDLDGCERAARMNRERYARLLETLHEVDLHREVHYQNSAGVSFESRVGDILFHVALHGSYHRGQVAAGVRRSGATPLFTDYIAFVRGGAPATKGA